MKTIERAHSPKNLWERVELPASKEKAIEVIEQNLQYWPEFLINKNKLSGGFIFNFLTGNTDFF